MDNTTPQSSESIHDDIAKIFADASTAAPPSMIVEPVSPAETVVPSVVAIVTEPEAATMDLSPQQRTAIALLTSGRTRSEAARAAGVGRATLYRWLNADPAFQAAFNTWQNDVRATAQAQLLAATHDAVAVVVNCIRRGDAALAWNLLRAQGITIPKKTGPTDALRIDAQRNIALRKQFLKDRQKKQELDRLDMETLEG